MKGNQSCKRVMFTVLPFIEERFLNENVSLRQADHGKSRVSIFVVLACINTISVIHFSVTDLIPVCNEY